jgi:hypothetical protein
MNIIASLRQERDTHKAEAERFKKLPQSPLRDAAINRELLEAQHCDSLIETIAQYEDSDYAVRMLPVV